MGVRLRTGRFQSRYARTTYKDQKVMLVCPLTFMNRSGHAIRLCVDYYNIEPEDMLVVHDDLDLPVGRIKAMSGSGAGGHKGVQSIIDHMGGSRFQRLKIGIGRPRYGEKVEDFVLARFYQDERNMIQKVIESATQACALFVSEGIGPTMNKINCQNLTKVSEDNSRCV